VDRIEKTMIAVILSLTLVMSFGIIFSSLSRSPASNSVGISRVESSFEFAWGWADVYIEGKWQEVHYYTYHFDVEVKNSRNVDASDLKVVVDLELEGKVIDSASMMIGTLKAGQSRNIRLDVRGVPHVYLYDDQGNYKNIVGVVSLYSGNIFLDRRTVAT
jgi:hypothetical protein